MDPFKTPELVVAETGTFVPEQQAYLNLIRTAQVLSQMVTDLLDPHGLSGKQYNALRAIRRGGPGGLPVSRIGEQMTDPRADVTRLLDRLERDGLLARANDRQDRRVVRVALTERGEALLAELDEPMIALHKRQLGHMTADELRVLDGLLRKSRGEPG
ncbi:MarR family winged helix-turn-helix transcriptional regulator [Tabrizicola sp.]|uniref:MarR family winged helix-turn-helix transcriptional regulator n=1 Tax=Tabrizicola sp. TaxID=2005166 RepID=UPI003F3BBABA